jgi:hypothetical protein
MGAMLAPKPLPEVDCRLMKTGAMFAWRCWLAFWFGLLKSRRTLTGMSKPGTGVTGAVRTGELPTSMWTTAVEVRGWPANPIMRGPEAAPGFG